MSLHAPPNNRRMFSDFAGDWETLRSLSLNPPSAPVGNCYIPSEPAQLYSCPSFGCSRHNSPCRCVVHTRQRTNTEPVFNHASGVNNKVSNAGFGGREVTLGDAALANNSGLYRQPGARSSTFAVARESREATIKAAGVAPEPLIALHEPEGTTPFFSNEQPGVNQLWGTPRSSPYHASASAVPPPAASFAPRSPRPGPKASSSSSLPQPQHFAVKTTHNRHDNHDIYPSRIAHTSSETREQQQLPVNISPCFIHEKNMRRFHSWYAQRESIRQERRDRYRRSANKMLPEFREAFPSLKKPEDLPKKCERVQRIHQECLQNWLPYTDRHPLAKKSHPSRKQRERQRHANSPQPSSFGTQGQYTSGQSTLQPASTSTKQYLDETVPQRASEDSYTYSTSEKSPFQTSDDMFRQTQPYPDTNTSAMYAAASVAPENVVMPLSLQQQYPFAGIQTAWQQPLASSIPLFNTGNEQKQLYPQQYFGFPFNFPCSSPTELNAATVPPHLGYQPFNPPFFWNMQNNPVAPRQQPLLFSTPMPIEHNPSHFAAPSVVNSGPSDVYGPFSVFAPETTHLPPAVCFPRSDLQMAHPSEQSAFHTHVPLARRKQPTAENDSGREKQKPSQRGFEKAGRAAAAGLTAKRTSKVNGVATSRPKTTEKRKTTFHLETPQKIKESAPRTLSPAKRRAAAPGVSEKSDSEQGKAALLRNAARSKPITFKQPVVERLRRPTPSADRRESLELGLIKGTAEHKMIPLSKTETTPTLQERLNRRRLPIPKTPPDTSPRRPALEKPSETPVLQEIRSPSFSGGLPPTPTLSPTTKPALDTAATAPSHKQLENVVGKSEQEQPAKPDAPGARVIQDEQMRYSTVEPHTSGPTYHVRLHSDYRGPHIIQEEVHRPFEDPQPIVLRVVGGREQEEQQRHLSTRDAAQNVVAVTPCYQEQPYSAAVLWERKEEPPRYAPQTLVERAAEQVLENEATFTERSEVSSSHSRSSETSGVTDTDATEELDDRSQNSAETAVFVPLACPSAPVFKYTRRRTLPPLITKGRR